MLMVAGAASLGASGAAQELPSVVEPRDDLVLDVRGVGAVVAPKLPGRGVERAALHELWETRRALISDHAAPGGRVGGAGENDDAVADRADGTVELPVGDHLFLQRRACEVLAHAGSVPSGQKEPVEGVRVEIAPRDRSLELGRLDELLVELDRLRVRSEATEQHAGEQSRIARRGSATTLGGENHLVATVAEHSPGDGHFGRI